LKLLRFEVEVKYRHHEDLDSSYDETRMIASYHVFIMVAVAQLGSAQIASQGLGFLLWPVVANIASDPSFNCLLYSFEKLKPIFVL
jgi:hypothetical protein